MGNNAKFLLLEFPILLGHIVKAAAHCIQLSTYLISLKGFQS